MSWIGLRDPAMGLFHPGGLGGTPVGAADAEMSLLAQGSLLIQFEPADDRLICDILTFGAVNPWPTELSLRHIGDQCIELRQSQCGTERVFMLDQAWLPGSGPVLIGFNWDAPGRRAVLSAYTPSTERLVAAEHVAPFPLGLWEARNLALDAKAASLDPDVAFLAISDQIEPIGPMPSLSGNAMVQTREGACRISELSPGSTILDEDGEPVEVHWIGAAHLPARGVCKPMVLRAPYHGLERDLIVAAQQKLHLDGPDIDYAFGTERVMVAAGLLAGDNTVVPAKSGPLVKYYQLVLSRPGSIRVSGVRVEPLDVTAVRRDQSLRRHSSLRGMPSEVMPKGAATPLPVLQPHDASALKRFGRLYG